MPGLHGVFNVCKPIGWTSHDVVARVRRLTGLQRVGHAGTLDPLAEGVLPVAVNRATRLIEQIVDRSKEYWVVARLGASTATFDAEGEVTMRRPIPPLTPDYVAQALRGFVGLQQQMPPAYSAVRIGGRRAYDLARSGVAVVVPARSVEIHSIDLCWLTSDEIAFRLTCSKGTYVRSIVNDLGERLGCGAHVRRLVRTRVGKLSLDGAWGIEDLQEAAQANALGEALISIDEMQAETAALVVDENGELAMRHGSRLAAVSAPADTDARGYSTSGSFLGLLLADGASGWQPRLALEAA